MIVYDLQAVQSLGNGERGIARYVAEVARALARRDDDVVDVFAWNDALPYVDRLETLGVDDKLRPFSQLRGSRVDLLHIGSPFELMPYQRFAVPVRADRTVLTCYDLIPYRFPDEYLRAPIERARYEARLSMLLGADEIVTDSESAADDVATMLGVPRARLTSIGAGVSEQFRPPTSTLTERVEALRDRFPSLEPGFVLVPTGMDWRKNTEGAIRAFASMSAAVRARHQLVIACRATDDQLDRLRRLGAELGVVDRLIFTGLVSDDELVQLYQSAELVFFPSFYEGFGLPVLEARRCGARVICSNTSSLPEVLPDPSATFNPYDPDEMAVRLEAALVDMAVAARLQSVPDPGFSWDRTADDLVAVYRRALEREPAAMVGRADAESGASRRRIGVVVDLEAGSSQQRSDRLVGLLDRLLADADVTAFIAHGASAYAGQLSVDVEPLSVLPAAVAMGDIDAVAFLWDEATSPQLAPYADLVPGHVIVDGCPLRDESLATADGDESSSDEAATAARNSLRRLAGSATTIVATCQHAASLVDGVEADVVLGACTAESWDAVESGRLVTALG